MNLQQVKLEMMKEYEGHDVYFHHTNQKDLHEGNFTYRLDTKGTDIIGMFAHFGNDDHFNTYGGRVLAVVVKRNARIDVRKVDDVHNAKSMEVFIEGSKVEVIEEL